MHKWRSVLFKWPMTSYISLQSECTAMNWMFCYDWAVWSCCLGSVTICHNFSSGGGEFWSSAKTTIQQKKKKECCSAKFTTMLTQPALPKSSSAEDNMFARKTHQADDRISYTGPLIVGNCRFHPQKDQVTVFISTSSSLFLFVPLGKSGLHSTIYPLPSYVLFLVPSLPFFSTSSQVFVVFDLPAGIRSSAIFGPSAFSRLGTCSTISIFFSPCLPWCPLVILTPVSCMLPGHLTSKFIHRHVSVNMQIFLALVDSSEILYF